MTLTDAKTQPLATDLRPRLKAWLSSEEAAAQRMAGAAFVIRVTGAVVIFLSQVLLARWMGGAEFGLYVYAWTWLQLIGDIVHLALPMTAQRLIPEYSQRGQLDGLRGFLIGSRWLVFGAATAAALIGAAVIRGMGAALEQGTVMPLYLACAALPFYSLSNMLDASARAYNAVNTALLPPFVLRPLLLIGAMAAARIAGLPLDAVTAMAAFALATWTATLLQLVLLRRCLKPLVPVGPLRFDIRHWVHTASPIFAVWSCYMLMSYIDVLVLRQFQPAEAVAHYYAAAKTLALVSFVHFAVSTAVAHRFAALHVANDRAALEELAASSVRWTFWPSLAAILGVLALGQPILTLFGPSFADGYPLMFILAVPLLARAAVGPAERILNMVGEQRRCAAIYAAMFVVNLGGTLAVAGPYGGVGVAWVIAGASLIEAALLFAMVKRRLGLTMLIGFSRAASR